MERDVVELLRQAGMDDDAIHAWLVTPSPWLDGERPADLLARGAGDRVAAAAHAQISNAWRDLWHRETIIEELREQVEILRAQKIRADERAEKWMAETQRLRAALKPFAAAADECDSEREHVGIPVPRRDHSCTRMTYKTLADARAALRGDDGADGP